MFDKGETFSGVPYDIGLKAVEELRALVPEGMTMAQMALRWILDNSGITCAIPGGKRPGQVEDNCAAADMTRLYEDEHNGVEWSTTVSSELTSTIDGRSAGDQTCKVTGEGRTFRQICAYAAG